MFDYGEQDSITYIAMRYVEAGTLKEHIAQKQMSLGEINNIVAQVSNALAYAHRQGIIHRDVKPGNILIDDQGKMNFSSTGVASSGISRGFPLLAPIQ